MNKYFKNGVLIAIFICIVFTFAFFGVPYDNVVFAKETSAKAMAVVEKSSGRLLYSENENERLPMASTTKIITAIYVIEHVDNLDATFEIPKEATKIEGTSIGLKEGEHLTIRELLYGLMLRSGNDSAEALAIYTSGSVKQFVDDVNEFLVNNNFNDTHLANPHGLPADNHYTTAKELALITAYALKNPTFREIVSTKEKKISNELKSKYSRDLVNKNKLLKTYEYADGVKTGYTRKAGRCFVGSATKDDMQVICVVLNDVPMFEDCEKMLDKAFSEYKLYKLVSKDDLIKKVNVKNSKDEEIEIFSSCDFVYPLKRSELKSVKMEVKLDSDIKAPLKSGITLGTINVTLENQLIFSTKIYNIKDVKPNDFGSKFNMIIEKM